MYLDVKGPCSAPMTKGCLSYVMPVDDGKMGAERIETSEEMLTVASQDSFGAKSTLDVDGKSYEMYRLDAVKGEGNDVESLPFSLKVLLANLLRPEDGADIPSEDLKDIAGRGADAEPSKAVQFPPARTEERRGGEE